MRIVLILLVACIALAALQAALAVVLAILAIMMIFSFLTRPAETIGFLSFCLFFGLVTKHPIATMVLVGFLAFLTSIRPPVAKALEPTLLPTAEALKAEEDPR